MLECFDSTDLLCNGWEQDADVNVYFCSCMCYVHMRESQWNHIEFGCAQIHRLDKMVHKLYSKFLLHFSIIESRLLLAHNFSFWSDIDFAI